MCCLVSAVSTNLNVKNTCKQWYIYIKVGVYTNDKSATKDNTLDGKSTFIHSLWSNWLKFTEKFKEIQETESIFNLKYR